MKRTRHLIPFLLLVIFWATTPAAAEPHRLPPALSLCTNDQHLVASLTPSPREDANRKLLSAPPSARRETPEHDRNVQVGAMEDLVALAFRSDSGFIPYVGAGITPLPPVGMPSEPTYRLGAGFACTLDDSTRLNLGYRFSTNGGRDFDGLLAPGQGDDQDRFNFSFGLQKSF